MLDRSNSIFIPSNYLRWMLIGLAIVAVVVGIFVMGLYNDAISNNKDVLTPLATIIQSLLTAITILIVLFLFQSSRQHNYLEKATSTFLEKTLPEQIRKHFQRYDSPFITRNRDEKSAISGMHQVDVKHIRGSLIADYLFKRAKGQGDADVSLRFFLQINIKTIFFGLVCERKDFAAIEGDRRTDFVFDEVSKNFSEETLNTLKNASQIQSFFAESARIAWRTIGWQCSLYEEGDRATFAATTRLSDNFLHDPSEQLFIANDIASMVRGIADGINLIRQNNCVNSAAANSAGAF